MMPKRTTVLIACCLMLAVAASGAVAAEPSSPGAASTAAASGDAPGTVTTSSGLKYVETAAGEGATPKAGQTVRVLYTISVDGKEVEGAKGGRTFEFMLGKDQALKGLEEGVSTMKVGGKRTLFVPPSLGYGAEGIPGKVPPQATLKIDVELKAIF